MIQSKPILTGTAHTLPFEKLSPRDFERLCLWLVEREGYERAEHLGAAGSEQGRDVVAWHGSELWAFQCKRVQSFGPSDALREIGKVLTLPEGQRPMGMIFLVTCDVSANTREQVRERCQQSELACDFWTGTELDEIVKRHPSVLREFFQIEGEPYLPSLEQIQAHRAALAQKAEYRRWANESSEEHYVHEESKVLPLLASPYDDELGSERHDLLATIRAHARLLVLGEPGMGKTVALQRMVWETVCSEEPVVPVFVPLLFFEGDLIERVRVALNETGQLYFEKLDAVRAFLRETRCLILFDGLNEVPGKHRQRAVVAVADFLRESPHHHHVVTSRPQDELWKKLRSSGIVEDAVVIQRITDDQARDYLIAHLGDQKGRELHDRLNECLRGLSRTPLLLWLIKEAGLAGQELPGNRGELFDRFVDRMLARDAKLEPEVSREAKRRALAHLAFSLQKSHQLACEQERALQIVAQRKDIDDPKACIAEALRHGLLQGERQVRFLHQSVQEYFVALAMCEIAEAERQAPVWHRISRRLVSRNVATWAREDWWAESFVQLAGLTIDPDWLVRELAPVRPWLAFWCSIEGRPVSNETKAVAEAGTVALLQTDDASKRLRAIKELGHFKNPRTIEYLVQVLGDEDDEVMNAASQLIVALGEPSVEVLLATLQESDRVRWAATRTLGRIWGMAELVSLGDAEADVRQEAARKLGALEDTRIIEPLIAAFNDSVPSVQLGAAMGLGQLHDERVVKSLIAVLRDGNSCMRSGAVEALSRIGQPAIEPLIAILRDSELHVRSGAIEALSRIGEPAIEPLIAILRDSDSHVRSGAIEALSRIGEPAVKRLIIVLKSTDSRARSGAIEALSWIGEPAARPIVAVLKDSDSYVRSGAVEALSQMGEPAVEPLIAVLRDDYAKMRRDASSALGRIWELPELTELGSDHETRRATAVSTLGKVKDVRVIPVLIAALKDKVESVRSEAALALALFGSAAVEPLIVALGSPDTSVRYGAIEALELLEDERAGAPLVAILQNDTKDLQRAATRALSPIWQIPALAELGSSDGPAQSAAADTLGKLGDTRAVEPLIAALRYADEEAQCGIAKALGALRHPQSVEPLITVLADGEPKVQQSAAEALGQLQDARATEPLIAALGYADSGVRRAACEALGRLEDPRSVEPLMAILLDDSEPEVQGSAVQALGKLKDAKATNLLVHVILTDKGSHVWQAAAEALGAIGGRRALQPLLDALRHGGRDLQPRAAYALGRLGDLRAVGPLISTFENAPWVQAAATEALGRFGEAVVEPLIITARSSSYSWVRLAAVEALGRTQHAKAVPFLVAAIQKDSLLHTAAARALGQLGKSGGEPLITILKDGDSEARVAAMAGLGETGNAQVIEILITALQDNDSGVRSAAAGALGRLGDTQAVEPLITALRDNDSDVRSTAVGALGRIGDTQAVESLVTALGDDDSGVRSAAAGVLGQLGDIQAVEPLIAALGDEDGDVRQPAAWALGQIGDARAVEPLIAALEDEVQKVRWTATVALGELGDSRAVEPLIATLQDKDWYVSPGAARALGELGDSRAVEPLIAALWDKGWYMRESAAEALERIGTPEARAALQRHKAWHRSQD